MNRAGFFPSTVGTLPSCAFKAQMCRSHVRLSRWPRRSACSAPLKPQSWKGPTCARNGAMMWESRGAGCLECKPPLRLEARARTPREAGATRPLTKAKGQGPRPRKASWAKAARYSARATNSPRGCKTNAKQGHNAATAPASQAGSGTEAPQGLKVRLSHGSPQHAPAPQPAQTHKTPKRPESERCGDIGGAVTCPR